MLGIKYWRHSDALVLYDGLPMVKFAEAYEEFACALKPKHLVKILLFTERDSSFMIHLEVVELTKGQMKMNKLSRLYRFSFFFWIYLLIH